MPQPGPQQTLAMALKAPSFYFFVLSKALCLWCWMHSTALTCIKCTVLKTLHDLNISWELNYKPNGIGKWVVGEGASTKSDIHPGSHFYMEGITDCYKGQKHAGDSKEVQFCSPLKLREAQEHSNTAWCVLKKLWSRGFVMGQTYQNHWLLLIFSGCFLVFQPPAVTQLAGWGPKQFQ